MRTHRIAFVAAALGLAGVAQAGDIKGTISFSGDAKQVLAKRIEDWKKSAARYDSEPETGEGRKELAARAKAAEAKRKMRRRMSRQRYR